MIQTNERRAKALNQADRKWLDVKNTMTFNQFLHDHAIAIGLIRS